MSDRCKWCGDPIESHEETQRCEHGDLYHQDCHYDMLYVNDKIEDWGDETYWCRYCFENHVEHQYMKHAPDNMEIA